MKVNEGGIGIMGTPTSSGNRGVLALGSSLVDLCYSVADPVEVVLFVGNRSAEPVRILVQGVWREIEVVNFRLSPRSPVRQHLFWILTMSLCYRCVPLRAVRKSIRRNTPWIAALERLAVVGDIRGGDSFSDIYGMKRFLLGFALASTVLLVKGEIAQFPQTYGPYASRTARFLAAFLLKRSSIVVARDAESQIVAESLIGLGARVVEAPDVAFSLFAVVPAMVSLEPEPEPEPDGGSSVIGINVNGLMYNGGYTRSNMFGLALDYSQFLQQLVKRLAAEHDGEFWLVPHTFAADGSVESDNECCRKLRDELPEKVRKRVRIVNREYDQHEIKGVIGMCDFFVGSRMHACIAALSQGIPCVGVAYSKKFRGVFDSVGVPDWVVDAREDGIVEAVEAVLECYRRREGIRGQLGLAAEQARIKLKSAFTEILTTRSCSVSSSQEMDDTQAPVT